MTIRGLFSPTHLRQSALALTAVPLVDAYLYLPVLRRGVALQLLVDTGADMTVLHPQDSLRLLPTASDWDALSSFPVRRVGGAGHGLPHRLVDAVVIFTHDDGTLDSEQLTLWIAEPDPQNVPQESLLGRDVLASFVMTFDRLETLTFDRP